MLNLLCRGLTYNPLDRLEVFTTQGVSAEALGEEVAMAQPAIVQPDALEELKERLQDARKPHARKTDSLLYNGLTVLILLFTGTASFLPTLQPENIYLRVTAQALAALAAFAVAMERSLNFGARWRFHLEMDNAYCALIDMLEFYRVTAEMLPDAERQKYLQDFMKELYAVRRREAGIPGAGTAGQP
jgi:hypothetical protein